MVDKDQNKPDERIAKQEKRLIILCIAVAFIMLLALSRRIF
ncbi:hypothetical protein ACFOLF_28075 [Paenibacillus sepulcri]